MLKSLNYFISIFFSSIWSRLCNPDRLPEINQQWWKSPIFMTYLNAINVNPQHAVRNIHYLLHIIDFLSNIVFYFQNELCDAKVLQ